MADRIIICALQIRDAAACAHTCTHGAAEGGNAADPCFLVDRNKVRKHKGTVDLLLCAVKLLRIHEHRHGRRDSLVAAAGKDDRRQLAAAHARIAPRRSGSPRKHANIPAAVPLQDLADLGAPAVCEPFFGKRAVVRNLAFDQRRNVFKVHGLHIIPDAFDGKHAPLHGPFLCVLLLRFFEERFPVLFDADDVRVVLRDHHAHTVPCSIACNIDIEHDAVLRMADLDRRVLPVLFNFRKLLRADVGKHLKLRIRIAPDDPRRNGRLKPFLPAGIRDDHALYVFDDAAAHPHHAPFWAAAEQRAAFRRSIRDGDRLRAPHCGDQFFLKDLRILLILYAVSFHPLFLLNVMVRQVIRLCLFSNRVLFLRLCLPLS